MIYRRLFNLPASPFARTFEDLSRLRHAMARWPEEFVNLPYQRDTAGVFPLINLTEDKDRYRIRAELPGVKSDELDIQATGNTISISGERKISTEGETAKYHRKEREAGKFSRIISMPDEVDPEKVEADLKDGILTITIPKAEVVKPKQIAVKS